MFRRITGKSIFQVSALLVFLLGCPTALSAQGHEISINPAKLPLFFARSEHFMIDLNYCKMFDEEWGVRIMLSTGHRKEKPDNPMNNDYTQITRTYAFAIGLKIFPFSKSPGWGRLHTSMLFQVGLLGSTREYASSSASARSEYPPLTRFGFLAGYRLPLGKQFFCEPELGYFLGSVHENNLTTLVKVHPAGHPWHLAPNIGLAF
ncbi:MAG: hypothetical protein R3D58_18470 [Saprospiraceae bacterium]